MVLARGRISPGNVEATKMRAKGALAGKVLQVARWNGIGEASWNAALFREASPLLEQMLQVDSHGCHLCPLSQNCSPLSISLGSALLTNEKILMRHTMVVLIIGI